MGFSMIPKLHITENTETVKRLGDGIHYIEAISTMNFNKCKFNID